MGLHSLRYVIIHMPLLNGKFMECIHAKQDCPSFDVLGRLSAMWIAYLKSRNYWYTSFRIA